MDTRSDRLFDNFANPPPFSTAQWPALFDKNQITNITTVLGIMRHVFDMAFNDFTIELVPDCALGANNHAFVHRIADHDPGSGLGRFLCVLHGRFPPI
jgi:hypothetical protein